MEDDARSGKTKATNVTLQCGGGGYGGGYDSGKGSKSKGKRKRSEEDARSGRTRATNITLQGGLPSLLTGRAAILN